VKGRSPRAKRQRAGVMFLGEGQPPPPYHLGDLGERCKISQQGPPSVFLHFVDARGRQCSHVVLHIFYSAKEISPNTPGAFEPVNRPPLKHVPAFDVCELPLFEGGLQSLNNDCIGPILVK